MSLVDQLIDNPDVSRMLCLAVALEAKRTGADIDARKLSSAFNRLVRGLDRRAFTDECRRLERVGPDRYLKTAGPLGR